MSLEQRVTILERKFADLEHAFHENNKVLEATHGVVSMILNEQRERFKEVNNRIDRLTDWLNDRFDKQDQFNQTVNENFKQLEVLITQLQPRH